MATSHVTVLRQNDRETVALPSSSPNQQAPSQSPLETQVVGNLKTAIGVAAAASTTSSKSTALETAHGQEEGWVDARQQLELPYLNLSCSERRGGKMQFPKTWTDVVQKTSYRHPQSV